MKKHYIKTPTPNAPTNYNNGEKVEWNISYSLVGIPTPRNNNNCAFTTDLNGYSIKSPKATIHLNDCAQKYLFGFVDEKFFYEFTKEEFFMFLNCFSYVDVDYDTKLPKIRVKNKTKKMLDFLEKMLDFTNQ